MAGYVGNVPVPQATQTRQSFTATASQTSFPTIGYTEGFFDCHLNGVKLLAGVDFNVGGGNGSDVILATGAALNDILEVTIFDTFNTSSGTFSSTTLKNNVTLKNDTHEDSDGGRASKIIYQGEQSGGEISTLAEIQASHDGSSDDQKSDLIFRTNDGSDGTSPTTAMVIDSGQNILIGKTDAETTISGGTPAFQLTGAGVDSSLAVTRREANAYGPTLFLSKSRNTTPNNYTIVQNNDSLGTIAFIGDDGTNLDTYGASISAEVDGTAGANDLPTRLKFSVTHDGASTLTEKLRIDEDGLKLNGDTAAANALNDYETGTFNLLMKGGSGDPSATQNLASQYTKIGSFVYFRSHGTLNNTGASGTIFFTGLPFSPTGVTIASIECNSQGTWTDQPYGYISGTIVYIQQMRSGNTYIAVNHTTASSGEWSITGHYMTNS